MYNSLSSVIYKKIRESHIEKEMSRLDENWPPALNNLTPYEKGVVRDALTKAHIDIQNTPTEAIKITNGKDPRLKGNGIVIFQNPDHPKDIGVWYKNEALVNAYDYETNKNLSRMSWKQILSKYTNIYFMDFDEDLSNKMKSKQADRKASQQGTVNRVNRLPAYKIPSGKHLDKSGYLVDPRKYVDMLAALKMNNAQGVLDKASKVYKELASKIDTIDFNSESVMMDNYVSITNELLSNFSSLKRANAEYESKKDSDSFTIEYLRNDVKKSITRIDDVIKRAQKYL